MFDENCIAYSCNVNNGRGVVVLIMRG